MILKVSKDSCEIKENEIWNVGDYNVHTVNVELSSDFNGLVNKVRYFVEDNCYDELIVNNIAQVPYEATLTEGTIKIGVYGYDADTNILVQSTAPVNKFITSGTYTGEADNTEPLTPTDKQQMESAIQQNTDDIIVLQNNKQNTLISGENIKTINNESILGSGNIEIGGGSGGTSDYTDLTNKPKINNVELKGNKSLNDLGIQPSGNYALKSEIPDVSNFITNSVNNLLNYYLKSETYTKQEVNNLIGQIATLQFQVVSTLPQIGDSKYIYLVPSSNPKTQNVKDEYIWVNNSWEQIGSTQIDLTGYATENWVNTQISEFLTQTQIQALINTALSDYALESDIPTKTSELTNDSGFITGYAETDPTVPSHVKNITQTNITNWNNKSDFSGNYNDLTNKPTIPTVPTKVSAFTNDVGYLTEHQDISGKVDKETGKGLSTNDFTTTYKNNVDSNTTARHTHSNKSVLDGISSTDITNWDNKAEISDIPDVSNFITKNVNDLTYYYTKTEVDGKVSAVYKYKGTVATYSDLPSTGLIIGDVYNVETDGSNYAWTGTIWDKLGGDIDLSGYQTKIDSSHKLSADLISDGTTNKTVTNTEKNTWNNKQNSISDLSTIRSGASAGATAVQPSELATVATSGSYNDLSNKPSEVTESTVSGWGFTKNTGTYSKPSGGIPKTDLASTVQASLSKADTALQSISSSDVTSALGYTPYNSTNPNGYTSNVGTITGITMNGSSKGTSGVVNLGTVITAHQDISGKLNTSKVKNANSTTAGDVYDVRYINTMIGNVETILTTLTTGSGV